jgi:lipopolysaccharide export system permease protein
MMFIFLLQYIMKFVDEFVGKGLSWWVIIQLIALNLAWMLVLVVPMSVLVATLMAFGAMSSQGEVTAMKASGMSLYRMMAPVVVLSIVLTGLMIEFNNNVLPDANHRVATLTYDVRRKKPTLTITPGLFSEELSGYSILVRKTFEHTNDLEGVTVYDYTNPNEHVVITGTTGRVSFSPDYKKLILDLQNGEIHQLDLADRINYRRLRFEKHRITMNVEGYEFERSGDNELERGGRELSAAAMIHHVDSLKRANASPLQVVNNIGTSVFTNFGLPSRFNQPMFAHPGATATPLERAIGRAHGNLNIITSEIAYINANEDEIHSYTVEIHKKYSIPVACFVFVFIGAPLGIMARRGTFGTAATLSVGFFLMYWACLIGGEKLADRGFVAPWLGMWIANIILIIVGGYLTVRTANENPRIQWTFFRRFVPKSLRSPDEGLEDIVDPNA